MIRQTAERMHVTYEQFVEAAAKEIPVGRVGPPRRHRERRVVLLLGGRGFVNGQVLYVAGGPKA